MLVIADSNEPVDVKAKVKQYCTEAGVQYSETKLGVGDYWVHQGNQVVCVERKTVADFHRSVTGATGRWAAQVRAMNDALSSGAFAYAVLMIEGMAFPHGSGIKHQKGYIEWPYTAFQASLLSAQRAGLMLIFTTPGEMPATLRMIGTWTSKKFHSSLMRPPRPLEFYGDNGVLITMLMALPGVGEVTAVALARHFKSLAALLSAQQEEIAKVNKVGPVTARKIYHYLHIAWETPDGH